MNNSANNIPHTDHRRHGDGRLSHPLALQRGERPSHALVIAVIGALLAIAATVAYGVLVPSRGLQEPAFQSGQVAPWRQQSPEDRGRNPGASPVVQGDMRQGELKQKNDDDDGTVGAPLSGAGAVFG